MSIYSVTHYRMSDRRRLSNEASDKKLPDNDEKESSDYYYDDSTGYRIYNEDEQDGSDNDDDDDNDKSDSGTSFKGLSLPGERTRLSDEALRIRQPRLR